MRIAIIRSSYYEELSKKMEGSAVDALIHAGMDRKEIEIIAVPGAFEIPLACKQAIEKKHCDGIVALGIIIQGETHHASEIARACTDGIMRVQLESNIPIANGVMYVDSREQAMNRLINGKKFVNTLLEILKYA